MSAVWTLAVNTWREQLRGRFFAVVLVFGGLIVYMGSLLGILAGDEELRVLTDFGFSFLELLVCGAVAFTAATGLLEELESKTVYLILARPVPRPAFLAGRFLGSAGAALSAILLMAAVLAGALWAKGGAPGGDFALGVGGAALKTLLTAAIATLLAVISTSVLSALVMTAIVWMLGHFTRELEFLAGHSGAAGALLKPLMFALPNLQLMNFRDRLHLPPDIVGSEPVAAAVLYTAVYGAFCLALAMFLFRKREF